MVTRRFDELLEELSLAHLSYRSMPRRPDNVRQLAFARFYLEDVRREIADERDAILAARSQASR